MDTATSALAAATPLPTTPTTAAAESKTLDPQLSFLICCIKHCDGKINWKGVAEDMSSTSGASTIKFRRLKEKVEKTFPSNHPPDSSNCVTPKAGGSKEEGTETKQKATPKKRTPKKKDPNAPTPGSRKRKKVEKEEVNNASVDHPDLPPMPTTDHLLMNGMTDKTDEMILKDFTTALDQKQEQ